ncbi:hypothetical protein N7510_010643 [Penicillium lagena]|uniref:uncharacterized protein n=1 Tax=Penicillium lagena TaxID=94218 RepID=UPI002541EDC4|nr:uncharacterized protein N7510_010643 [Penicillium lagena]KAJ5601109.1 hypothetical protein N7510_010643 [Penicillium lagena]
MSDPQTFPKSPRVLACVFCQQRKMRRKRRFPERELLNRLRKYEDLLRLNNVKFDPLHKTESEESLTASYGSEDEQPESEWSSCEKLQNAYEAKNIYHAMKHGLPEPTDDNDTLSDGTLPGGISVGKAWDQFDTDDHILFSSRNTAVDLSILHPEPVHIFRLWQIYLDNVNPLLKVIHSNLQQRIIEAASNILNISPALEALMFSIYCMATLSLTAEECATMCGSPKQNLLKRYQVGCQQALLKCGFLRSSDRECLTALFLYLVSVHPNTDPRSLSSLLGIAIRIAQRIGIHSEAANSQCTVFEAEMRRRLWWSLILFDSRISELSDYKTTMLAPTWDCKVPINTNDSELRVESKEPPVSGKVTESIFAVVRGELGDFIRHAPFHLDFTNPALKPVSKPREGVDDIAALEKMVEEKFLHFCDPANPLHFMTIWSTRAHLSKSRLLENFSKRPRSSSVHQPLTQAQRDATLSYALRMLESNTKVMTSPLTRGYVWFCHLHFPLPAYIHILQDLIQRRSWSKQSRQAWEVMSENYEAWFCASNTNTPPNSLVSDTLFGHFTAIILQAWEALETPDQKDMLAPPRIISSIRQKRAEVAADIQNVHDTASSGSAIDASIDDLFLSMPLPMGFGNPSPGIGMGEQDDYSGMDPRVYSHLSLGDMNQSNWASMHWGLG